MYRGTFDVDTGCGIEQLDVVDTRCGIEQLDVV